MELWNRSRGWNDDRCDRDSNRSAATGWRSNSPTAPLACATLPKSFRKRRARWPSHSRTRVILQRVFIEDGALTWPNGYDWDPIALHDEMKDAKLLKPAQAAE